MALTININHFHHDLETRDALKEILSNMSQLSDAIDQVRDAQTAEATRVEAVITILKSNPTAEETQAAIAELQGIKSALDNQEPGTTAPPTV